MPPAIPWWPTRVSWLAAQAGRQDLRPEYTAPEQAQGLGVGPQTDLYALGLVLFEALTGQPPFRGGTPLSTLYQQVNEASPALASLGVRSAAAQDTLDRALAKSPNQRYASGAVMAHALREAETMAVLPAPAHVPAPVPPPVSLPEPRRRRSSAWVALLALGVVALVSVAALAGLATGRIQGREVADFAARLLQREVASPAPMATAVVLSPSATPAAPVPTATKPPTATSAPAVSPSPSATFGRRRPRSRRRGEHHHRIRGRVRRYRPVHEHAHGDSAGPLGNAHDPANRYRDAAATYVNHHQDAHAGS